MELKDRVALVTAGGSGIGRAGALAMAREGAHVIVTDLAADRAAAVAAEISAAGGQGEGFGLDVLDDAALEGAILAAAKRHGRLDVLHSHAGVQVPGRLDQVDAGQMDLSWRLNVRAHFVAAKAAMQVMAPRRQGSIIVTSSNSGVQYDREMIAYCTTKHAVIAMVRQIAADYARHNVRCNALCPGFVDTVFNAGFEVQMGGRAALEDYVRDAIPMGRFGSAEEIGEAILYLASDKSAFMTGHALVIDGAESL
ncbi:NAD(P)-dependent dehydrogenase (short-subunit alcohol dehydrogenase family) [Mycoplana sp. BE70]|uniref:SDR family NAD(P)-dependent oxidoreductase n=1 Tax=Mycoplana sp. BE70 TaxID=2817775 RepID=UPI00285B3B0C|nr:SDR family oxidoreductase [Mycoplana sp. BE70]MDR6755388.1 NAD(P)-dependent dehydrogenase (short-subunit alcohol dehydrogenase family) [Mycoplana sp. BE70]